MANKVKGFLVSLKEPVTADHAENLKYAFSLIEGVADVRKIDSSPSDDQIVAMKVLDQVSQDLFECLSKWRGKF